MNRPKFAVGEVVELVSTGVCPDAAGKSGEITKMHYRDACFTSTAGVISGWFYWVAGVSRHVPGLTTGYCWEERLGKRPDLREPFSLEAMKEKYAPQKEEA